MRECLIQYVVYFCGENMLLIPNPGGENVGMVDGVSRVNDEWFGLFGQRRRGYRREFELSQT